MNILFYSPLKNRSKDTESLMEAFVKDGCSVFLLTQYKSETYHHACEKLGVSCYASGVNGTDTLLKQIRQAIYLIRFCVNHRIDIVYAQLEPATFIAALSQYFIKSKVVLVRHHVDLMETDTTKWAHFLSIISYKLARHVVVVSRKAKEYMVRRERISAKKIRVINIGYNFNLWPKINATFISKKREVMPAKFVIVTASRFVKSKRINLSIKLIRLLRDSGLDCCLVLLGEGEEEDSLRNYAIQLGISPYVVFEGYIENVIDYIAMSDMMVHFSLTESSATVIKEAGLVKKPVLVCHEVGDFDDYLLDTKNGFLVSKNFPLDDAVTKIQLFVLESEKYKNLGTNLFSSVIDNFSIESVIKEYRKLNTELQ